MRELTGIYGLVARLAAITIALVVFYTAFFGGLEGMQHRALVLTFLIPLTFLYYPARPGAEGASRIPLYDLAAAFAGVAVYLYVVQQYQRLKWRFWYIEDLSVLEMTLGTVAVLLALEATRRTVGWFLPVLTLFFIGYMHFGTLFPGIFFHTGISPTNIVEHLYLTHEGLFNYVTGILATFLFTFIAFGTFLRVSGLDKLFLDFAIALAGRSAGGPANVAVVASGLLGMITGSNIANVITTGSLTIPLMKRVGYPSHRAAAIEAVASTGGQILPPMMGVGVFLLSELTGIPLVTIIIYSILPAALFFLSLLAYVNFSARRMGLQPMAEHEIPNLRESALKIVHLIIPVGALIYVLLLGYTPFYASALCAALVVPISWLRKETRITPAKLVKALEETTQTVVGLTGIMVTAALLIGAITQTGFTIKVTSVLVALSGDSVMLLILLIAAVSYVLGMAVPTVTAYVLVATVAGPAMEVIGIPLLAAHLIIFWLAQDSALTPPMCQTAFVAARIAKAPLMKTGLESVKVGKVIYYVPILFAYSQILSGNVLEMFADFAYAAFALVLFQAAFEGFGLSRLSWLERWLHFIGGAVLTLAAVQTGAAALPFVLGGVLIVAFAVYRARRSSTRLVSDAA